MEMLKTGNCYNVASSNEACQLNEPIDRGVDSRGARKSYETMRRARWSGSQCLAANWSAGRVN